jgi:hypothetical protein
MDFLKNIYNNISSIPSYFTTVKIKNWALNQFIWGVKNYYRGFVFLKNNQFVIVYMNILQYIKETYQYLTEPKKPVLKISSLRLYNDEKDTEKPHYLVEVDEEKIYNENLLSENEKQYLLSLNYIDLFNIKNKNGYLKDTMILLKEKDKCFVYIKKTQKDVPDLNKNACKTKFLSVVYVNNITQKYIDLNLDKEYYIVGNELFSPAFVYKLLLNENQADKFNMNYSIRLLSSRINIFELNNKQYIEIEENGFNVKCLNK